MLRPAFSTVACPTWTIERVAASAGEWGFMGVEFRSFGEGSMEFACDPALTDGAKVRRIMHEAGVETAAIASGVRFDAPIWPPVVGHLHPERERSVRAGKHMVDVAAACAAPYIRVYAFEVAGRKGTKAALPRIVDRLSKVCDYARGREVMVLIENGGSFPLASDLIDLIARVNSPQLGACYDVATALSAGENSVVGVRSLARWLRITRLRDVREGRPCRLGTGAVPCREFVRALHTADEEWGTDPWISYTWDRAWLPELSPAEEVLPTIVRQLTEWSDSGGGGLGQRHKFEPTQSVAPAMMIR